MKIGRPLAGLISALLMLPAFTAVAGSCKIEKQASLPVTMSGIAPMVPVTIDGQVMSFGIDTGAQMSLITPEAATLAHLPPDTRHELSHVRGTSGSYNAVGALVKSMTFAGVEYKGRRMTVIPIAPEHMRVGQDLQGLIGADLLADFDIEYDVPARTFTFYHISGCPKFRPPWQGSYAKVPLFITDGNSLTLPVRLDGHMLTAIFDTGATGTALALPSAVEAGVTKEMLAKDMTHPASGVGGYARVAYLHRFGSLSVGSNTLAAPTLIIADFRMREGDMLLGEDYMRGRRFWISYATQTLFVQDKPMKEGNKD